MKIIYSKKKIMAQMQSNGAVLVTFQNPQKRNAFDLEMADAARELKDILKAENPRVLVFQGDGTAFSAGGDLEFLVSLTQNTLEHNHKLMREFYSSFLSLAQFPCPTIAHINGHAVGAGFCFAAACDLKFAEKNAKVGVNFVRIGLAPGMGAEYWFQKYLPFAKAAEMIYTGRIYNVSELANTGFFNFIGDRHEVQKELEKIIHEITSNSAMANSHAALTLRNYDQNIDTILDQESRAQAKCFQKGQIPEAVDAFRNKKHFQFTV